MRELPSSRRRRSLRHRPQDGQRSHQPQARRGHQGGARGTVLGTTVSVTVTGEAKARAIVERFHANTICRRNGRGARPACHQHGHRNGRQKSREGLQSEADGNNDMGRQSTGSCSSNDAHLCLNTQVLALLTAKTDPRREILEFASLTGGNTQQSHFYPRSCTSVAMNLRDRRIKYPLSSIRHGSEGRDVKHSSVLGGSVGRLTEVGCG